MLGKSSLRILAFTAVVSLAVSACGSGGSGSSQEASRPMDTIRIGNLHSEGTDPALIIARENDIFQKYGLKAELVEFDNGTALSQALQGGSIDVGVAGSGLLASFAPRYGVVILPCFVEADSVQLFASKSSGINGPADLAGHKVALTVGTTSQLLLNLALQRANVDPSSVEVVNMSAADAATAFISGAVPAAAMWVPHTSNVRQRVPDAHLVTSLKDFYPDDAMLGGFVVTKEYIKEHRAVLESLAGAFVEGNDLMLSDTEKQLKMVWETAYQEQEDFEAFKSNWDSIRFLTGEEWQKEAASGQVAEWLDRMQQGFVTVGALDHKRDIESFFDASVLEAGMQKYKATK